MLRSTADAESSYFMNLDVLLLVLISFLLLLVAVLMICYSSNQACLKSIWKCIDQCFLTMNKPRSCFCVFQMKKMTCSWIGNDVFVIGRRYCVQSRAWWKWDKCIVFTDECTKWFRDQGKHLINFCELNIQTSHQIGRYSFVQIA